MNMGQPVIICLVAAVVTGVFGGLLRDLICRRTPLVLHKELYASVAFIAAGLYMAQLHFGVSENIAIGVTLVTGFLLRLAAIRFSWQLPVFRIDESADKPKEEAKS